jgi:hypothetical protein
VSSTDEEQAAVLRRAREAVGAARETQACMQEQRIIREHLRKLDAPARAAHRAWLAAVRADRWTPGGSGA